jgi:AhpD family alkylhydroperoxidase
MRGRKLLWGIGLSAVALLAGFRALPTAAEAAEAPAAPSAERQAVYAEIEQAFGFVPGFIQSIPDISLRHEWNTLKTVQMAPGAIPNKYRELIGLAVAAERGCEYCTYFHTQFAKLNGATDAEIEDAVHFAKSNVGWSTYLHGMQYDLAKFKSEVDRIVANAKAEQAAKH